MFIITRFDFRKKEQIMCLDLIMQQVKLSPYGTQWKLVHQNIHKQAKTHKKSTIILKNQAYSDVYEICQTCAKVLDPLQYLLSLYHTPRLRVKLI